MSVDAPVTVITGIRKGIGRELASWFAARGHRVVGCSRGPLDGPLDGVEHHVADVTDESAVLRMFASIRRTHGRVDNLVNNAGIASMNHALLTPLSTFNAILATNVTGAFLFCREAAKLMMPRKYGRIVSLGSVAVPLKLGGEVAYAASKAALATMTEVLAVELGPLGITVNTLGVNPVATDLTAAVPEEKLAGVVARQAIPRLGTIGDVANAIEFFFRKESGLVTGQTLYLGGVS